MFDFDIEKIKKIITKEFSEIIIQFEHTYIIFIINQKLMLKQVFYLIIMSLLLSNL